MNILDFLFGKNTFKTNALRYWLNIHYAGTRFGRYVMWLYRRCGRRIAAWVGRNPRLGRIIFGPIFDHAYTHVQRVLTPSERAYILCKTRGEF